MPARKNRRRNNQEEQEMDQAEEKSKWAQLIEREEEGEEVDAAALYQKEKTIFNFDFSKEHLLLHQK